MSRDELVAAALVLACATLVTTHVALVVGLAGRAPRWHSLIALVIAPLAPYWGWRSLRRRSLLWVASALVYAVLRLVASR
jgi:hypothetical protein